jgi:hypothetical protein
MQNNPIKGGRILAKDHTGFYCEAKVVKTNKGYVYVSFVGWSKKYNEWVKIGNIKELMSKPKKKIQKKATKKLTSQEQKLRKYVPEGKINKDCFKSLHAVSKRGVHFCVASNGAITYWFERRKKTP